MLPERYRRLLKRRLRRRPLLPFLLAATVAVDLAIAATTATAGSKIPIAFGFLSAQVGLLATWAAGGSARLFPRLLLAILGVGLVGLVGNAHYPDFRDLRIDIAVYSALLIVNLFACWAIGFVAARFRPATLRWSRSRFTVRHLLWAMLFTAVAAILARWGQWSSISGPGELWLIVGDAVPTAVMLALALASPAGWRRFALLVAIPLACAIFNSALFSLGRTDPLGAYYTSKALFIGIWLYALSPELRSAVQSRMTTRRKPEGIAETNPDPPTIAMHLDAVV